MVEEEHIDASASTTEPVGYPGGPYDTSLLVKYEHHIVRHIWFGEERVKGSRTWVEVGSEGFTTSLTKIDTDLVSAFAERWHLETSSFHMPFGEMTITLDDVSCLLHLPIREVFWSPQDINEGRVVDYLGVSQQQVRDCKGSYYKLE
ncbi:unnamed protein product [Lathyrus sativus]|nr:unnamed protein product [Lathyrus sativus]